MKFNRCETCGWHPSPGDIIRTDDPMNGPYYCPKCYNYLTVKEEVVSGELTIKKERVLEAAKRWVGCDIALKALFPEAFEKPKPEIDLTQLKINPDTLTMLTYRNIFYNAEGAGFPDGLVFYVRASGEFKNKAFYLDSQYNWNIVRDEEGGVNLIPSHKDNE